MSVDVYKARARRLAEHLKATHGIALPHSAYLEAVAAEEGVRNWNVLAAQAQGVPPPPSVEVPRGSPQNATASTSLPDSAPSEGRSQEQLQLADLIRAAVSAKATDFYLEVSGDRCTANISLGDQWKTILDVDSEAGMRLIRVLFHVHCSEGQSLNRGIAQKATMKPEFARSFGLDSGLVATWAASNRTYQVDVRLNYPSKSISNGPAGQEVVISMIRDAVSKGATRIEGRSMNNKYRLSYMGRVSAGRKAMVIQRELLSVQDGHNFLRNLFETMSAPASAFTGDREFGNQEPDSGAMSPAFAIRCGIASATYITLPSEAIGPILKLKWSSESKA